MLNSRYERKLFTLGSANMVSAIATVLATSSNLPEAGIDFLKTLSVATFGHIVDTLERQ